ncbi:MAG: hypothetical protein H6760_00865 [Candidatus Nomurabacteria bacterium]|nr:MAG: hypothetical protein H6760_00865 [Candidatus Nomurabacteria bacterium]
MRYFQLHLRKRLTNLVTFGLAVLMLGVLMIASRFVGNANAEFGLTPRWSTEPHVGDSSVYIGPWSAPIQNSASSRLFVYTDDIPGGDRNNYVFRVNDDGSSVLGTKLTPALNVGTNQGNNFGFVSDGIGGAYVGWTSNVIGVGYNNVIARVGSSGNLQWVRANNDAVGVSEVNWGQYLASDTSGNALITYFKGSSVCAMKLSRATGVSQWSSSANCTVGARSAREIYHSSSNAIVRGMISDQQGGMIVLHRDGAGSILHATRVNSTGTVLWTVSITDATGGSPTGLELFAKTPDTFYAIWRKSSSNFIQAFHTSDGSAAWVNPLLFAESNSYDPSSQFDRAKFVWSGADELATAWRRTSDSALVTNRINVETGAKRWASDVVVTTEAEDNNYKVAGTAQGVTFFAYCHDNVPSDSALCEMQGVSAGGALVFSADGVDVRRSKPDDMQFGLHTVTSSTSNTYCLDEGFRRIGESVGAQSYCLNSLPTVSDPICSIDNGSNFVLCSDAQQGSTVSHVQVTCDPGDFVPLSEGMVANTSGVHEDSAFIEGRYVVYRYLDSGPRWKVYAYDLGPDQQFGTGDDLGTKILVDEGSIDTYPQDIKNGRILYWRSAGGTASLRFYNLSDDSIDPGTLTSVAFSSISGYDGRYLVYAPSGTTNLSVKDLGVDEVLGTADDGGSTQLNSTPMANYARVSGRYAVGHSTGGLDDIYLFDLTSITQTPVYSNASVQADVPDIQGRYIAWMDFRNDPNGYDDGSGTSNGDIFIYDMGPDEQYGTSDDIGESQISASAKKDSSPRIAGTKILWHQTQNGGASDANQNVMMYDLGPDGEYGTADDTSETQLTNSLNNEYWPRGDGENIVWLSDQNGPANTDIFITPAGIGAASISEVRFTMTAPSGTRYVDQVAGEVNASTYTLYYPELIDEEGQWTVQATCEDVAGQTVQRESIWDVGPWPFSDQQKLSVYDGVAQISKNSGDTMEIGNAGRDITSNGNIYIRPNNSYAGAYFEGVASTGSQRLHLPYGVPGQHTVFAKGTGTVNSADGASGIAGIFTGLSNNAGGSGVYGDVMSCASSGGCAAGYFQGGDQIGLYASTNNASLPALRAENAATPNASTLNMSALFTGKVQVSQDLSGSFSPDACVWVTVDVGDTVCPNEGFVFGYDSTSFGVADKLYCCGN